VTAASGLLAPGTGNKTSPCVDQKGKEGEGRRKREKEKKIKRKCNSHHLGDNGNYVALLLQ
jgi:hypothetical protein